MSRARLIRRVRFRAAHRYGLPGSSEPENRAAFGAQADSHEHDWTLEVHVVGEPSESTGFLVDLDVLDRAIAEVTAGWDGGDINELVPEVRSGAMQPSTEALARWLYLALAPRVPAPARLERVRLFESPELGSEYPA